MQVLQVSLVGRNLNQMMVVIWSYEEAKRGSQCTYILMERECNPSGVMVEVFETFLSSIEKLGSLPGCFRRLRNSAVCPVKEGPCRAQDISQ